MEGRHRSPPPEKSSKSWMSLTSYKKRNVELQYQNIAAEADRARPGYLRPPEESDQAHFFVPHGAGPAERSTRLQRHPRHPGFQMSVIPTTVQATIWGGGADHSGMVARDPEYEN